MIYSNCSEMLKIFNTNKVNYNYNIPNKDILTVLYWYIKIQNKISKLKNMEFNKICTNIF